MLSPKLNVYNSPLEGRGIVAKEKIQAGEEVIIFEGREISDDLANDIYKNGDDYMLQISEDSFLYLPGPEKFVNHSCSPNCAFLHENGKLVALREINENEEITFDYSANENTPFAMKCQCGHKKCRKMILPYKELTPMEQESIKSILSPYLKVSNKLSAIY